MRHTISVLVENKFGVLARIAGLFSARGYNISSLAVAQTHKPDISCMTIVVEAEDEKILEQIKKQLNRLIDVLKVTDFTKKEHVERELVLVKVDYSAMNKTKLENILDKCQARIIQRKGNVVAMEFTGEQSEIKQLLQELEQLGIEELVRTGKIAMGA